MTLAQQFMKRFAGLERAHGIYTITSERESGKKVGKAVTRREPVTEELWQLHFEGKQSLGIVPIRDDATCVFGAIDIDSYKDFDVVALAAKVEALGLPLLVCRSKSGGAHLYLFTSAPIPAKLMRARLAEFARLLEYPKAEIFPKQEKLIDDENAVGGWINICYFAASGASTRFLVLPDGRAASALDFLARAKGLEQSAGWFEIPSAANQPEGEAVPVSDGPPCLQKLVQIGVPEGSRDNFLLDYAGYERMRGTVGGVDWQDRVREVNRTTCGPPLPAGDVDRILKQATKGYNYGCKKEPLQSHCNSAVCRIRKYGVGRMEGLSGKKSDVPELPVMNGLRKLNTEPPVYYLEVEGRTVKLTSQQLASPRLFQTRCMEAVDKMIPVPSQAAWQRIIQELLDNIVITEVPEEERGTKSTFRILLDAYLSKKAPAQHKEQVASGSPWTDENGITWFNLDSLLRFLVRNEKEGMTKAAVTAFLYEIGAEHKRFRDIHKEPWVWGVPETIKPKHSAEPAAPGPFDFDENQSNDNQ